MRNWLKDRTFELHNFFYEIYSQGADGALPRFKPFKYAYEKEIVMYAHVRKLDYFSTECKYAPNSYRGHVRAYIKNLEKLRPRSILGALKSILA